MPRTFIGAIKTAYRTVGCGETHCKRIIKKLQTCQHDQQLYKNEYNSYILMVESSQLKNGDSLYFLKWKIYDSYTRFIILFLYLQIVLDLKKKERKPKTDKDSTARYHSVRSFSPHPNFWHPHLQNCNYVRIVSTPPKYLKIINFQILS